MTTTTRFLTEVRRVGQFPTQATASLDDASILLEADRAIQTSLIPLLLRVQEEWFVRRVTVALVANQANYAIPRRSIGSRVRDVVLVHLARAKLSRDPAELHAALAIAEAADDQNLLTAVAHAARALGVRFPPPSFG